VTSWLNFAAAVRHESAPAKIKVTLRILREAVEDALMANTRVQLEEILPDDLGLTKIDDGLALADYASKRELIGAYISGHSLPWLVDLARRIVDEVRPDERLSAVVDAYLEGGGVSGAIKNLIFAANGPKPELVLRDAINNEVEITKNAEHCLVFDRPVPADGLTFQALVAWWRDRQQLGNLENQAVGRALHERLVISLAGNHAELQLYYAYNRRYLDLGFNIPALVPQVYLHYDPYTARSRGPAGSPLARQRKDFLLLFSERRRVVLEVDGSQHYSTGGRADSARYAEMAAEDRRLRLAGYEVYRFGGRELDDSPGSGKMLDQFFFDLQARDQLR